MRLFRTATVVLISFLFLPAAINAQLIPGFETNTEKRSIDLEELIDGGPGKDGIPSY